MRPRCDVRGRVRRLDVGRFLGIERSFPARHDARRDRIADDVRRRAAHVEEMVDGEDQQQPGLGDVEHRQGRGDHHQACARNAGHALGGDHQHQQHGDFLAEAEIDAIGLGDEDRREGHVHHRAVEVERIAERQDEAGDARRHAEPVERLQRARIGGLATTRSRKRARSGRGCSGRGGACAGRR